MKFKVGDRVIIISDDTYFDTVRDIIMTVVKVGDYGDGRCYDIDSDDNTWEACCGEEEIELAVMPGEQLLFAFMKDK